MTIAKLNACSEFWIVFLLASSVKLYAILEFKATQNDDELDDVFLGLPKKRSLELRRGVSRLSLN